MSTRPQLPLGSIPSSRIDNVVLGAGDCRSYVADYESIIAVLINRLKGFSQFFLLTGIVSQDLVTFSGDRCSG